MEGDKQNVKKTLILCEAQQARGISISGEQLSICMHYENEVSQEKKVPILAVHASEVKEGQVLYLRIKRNAEAPEAD